MLYKYPRTYHLPFSETITSDDKVLKDTFQFHGKQVIVTEKMDGENSTIYNNYYHARSLDSKHSAYHSWLMSYIQQFQYMIPDNWRVCGEYLFAKHSIEYHDLESYFLVFSVWDGEQCLSWDDTEKFCKQLGLQLVPVLYKGEYDEELIKKIAKETVSKGGEGIVVRLQDSFSYADFPKSVAKFVRKNHVQTDTHWKNQDITKNKLKKTKK